MSSHPDLQGNYCFVGVGGAHAKVHLIVTSPHTDMQVCMCLDRAYPCDKIIVNTFQPSKPAIVALDTTQNKPQLTDLTQHPISTEPGQAQDNMSSSQGTKASCAI